MLFQVGFNQTQQKFPIEFRNLSSFPIQFRSTHTGFSVRFDSIQTASIRENVEYYEGDYDVTPAVNSQTLDTAKKFMGDDVTVNPIPFFDVSNTAGGTTVYIGNEVLVNGN